MGIALQAENVSYRIGQAHILQGADASFRRGTFVALVGPNGAGKSTFLRLISGEIKPTGGRILLDGKPLPSYTKPQLALRRAVMPQEVLLTFSFTAEEVVMMGRYPHRGNGTTRTKDLGIVADSMKRTETESMAQRLYPTLSGGEQARVTLARVLAQQAPIVLLDEPTASLDPRHQHLVMEIGKEIAASGGTVVAVLHDLNLAATYADDVVVLHGGRIQAAGAPVDVLTPSVLKAAFQTDFYVSEHPRMPGPLVLSLPRHG